MSTKVDLEINTKAKTAELTRATAEAQEFINTIKLGVGIDIGGKLVEGLGEGVAFFKEGVIEGVKFNSTVQDAQLAIAALLKSFEPEKFHTLNDAMAESGKAVELLRKKAVTSPFNFDQLLESLQSVSGVLFAGGVKDLQKQVDLTLLLASAAKTLNVPQQYFASESRDLIEGKANRTFLGRGLNIKDADVKKAADAGQTYEFFSKKLEAYGEAGAASVDNYSTRVSVLHDKIQQLEGVSTQGIFDKVSDGAKNLATAIDTPEFENAAKTVGSQIAAIVEVASELISVVTAHPQLFAVLAEGTFAFAAAMAVLNLPKLVVGLTELATSAVPAVANLAALGTAARSDAPALAAATAQVEANTAALRANAAAATATVAAQEATVVIGDQVAVIEADTAALQANTAAKEANAAASVGGAGSARSGLFSAGPATAALTAILSIVQVYVAYEAYVDTINQANAGLQTKLEGQLATINEQVRGVATQAQQAALITSLKDYEQRLDNAIRIAKANSLETDGKTVSQLQKQKDLTEEQLVKVQALTPAQLDMQRAAQSAELLLEKQVESVGKLADGFEKARLKYREFLADQQIQHGATLDERLAGNRQRSQLVVDELNEKALTKKFSSVEDVRAFADSAATDARNKQFEEQDAALQKSIDAYQQKLGPLKAAVTEQQALVANLSLPARVHTPQRLAAAQAQLTELESQFKSTQDSLGKAQGDSATLRQKHDVDRGLYTLASERLRDLSKSDEDGLKIKQQAADEGLAVQLASDKAEEADVERSFKNRAISLEDYAKKRREILQSENDVAVAKINNDPDLREDEREEKLHAQKIANGASEAALNQDIADKGREQTVQQLEDQAKVLEIKKDQAAAAGDVVAAEDLGNQIQLLQAKAQIEGDATLSLEEKKNRIDAITSALQQEYQATVNQRDAEQALELQEQQTARALSGLQSKRQIIEAANALPDDKNDALRQILLAQNQVLDQQIQLLEQRRQLALQDLSKSPNDRALTAAGIQQQEDQAVAQKVGNQITADKLTFTGQFNSELGSFAQSFGSTAQQSAAVITGTLGTAINTISSNLAGVIEGTVGVKQGFINMAEAVVDQLIQLIIKLGITLALQEALDVAGVVSAPAAGLAAGTLAAGLASAGGLAFADGGLVPGAPSHSDNRIATIASGEYVTRTAAVNHYGPGLFEALNSMAIPRHVAKSFDFKVPARRSLGFSGGGLVAPLPFVAGAQVQKEAKVAPVHVAFVNDRASLSEWARKGEGRKIIIDLHTGLMRDIGFTS